jgi:hypothetical protein
MKLYEDGFLLVRWLRPLTQVLVTQLEEGDDLVRWAACCWSPPPPSSSNDPDDGLTALLRHPQDRGACWALSPGAVV